MKLKKIKIDFHRNGWVVQKPFENRFFRFFLDKWIENHPKNLLYIADNLYQLGENRAIFLLDYFYQKYKHITSDGGLTELERNGFELHSDHRDSFVGMTADGGKGWLYVFNGREVMSDKGHFMIGCLPVDSFPVTKEQCYYPNGIKLEDALRRASDLDALIIPTHPIPRIGLFSKAFMKIIKEPSGARIGLGRKELIFYRDYFDAIESRSLSMSSLQTLEVEGVAGLIDKPTVFNSDAPVYEGMLSCNLFESVDFSSPEKSRESIRKGLSEGEYETLFVPPRRKGREVLEHALINLLGKREEF